MVLASHRTKGGRALPERSAPQTSQDAKELAREIVRHTGGDIRAALPLGLGKAVTLINALTEMAIEDRSIRLSIFTALTLEKPSLDEDMARRFLGPAMDRLFGAYPEITYAEHLRAGTLPDNIEVTEFFFLAGRWTDVAPAQQNHVSVNYTDALEVLLAREPNVILPLVARDGDQLSLSCNTDITSDLLRLRRNGGAHFLMAAEVNPELPFMGGTGAVPIAEADLLLDDPAGSFELFSVTKRPVTARDHAIGLHASRLVRDGGTLQIGIGAVGDAVAHALLQRHRGRAPEIWFGCPFPLGPFREDGRFDDGLYAVTEMLVDAMLPLFDEGVVSREEGGVAIHAGFFVGCRDFYARLREMPAERRDKIAMMPVSFTNALYGDEEGKRAARRDARFINSGMKATLLGAVTSDGTSDGEVVSGVGGQFDFVAQAFALEDARAVIAIPATRSGTNGTESNIVWSYPHATIPRHMRDIVVTEYGIADLRGRSDADVIAAMLSVADSRFQPDLLEKAKKAGKIPRDFALPEANRCNTPEAVKNWLKPFDLPTFPFGTDFDADEREILPVLSTLKKAQGSPLRMTRLGMSGLRERSPRHDGMLKRLGLSAPGTLKERVAAALVRGAAKSVK